VSRVAPSPRRLGPRVRQTMQKWHLWATLFVGLFVLAVTTTGVAALFVQEVQRATHAHLYRITPGPPVGLDAALASARAAHPDLEMRTGVNKPGDPYLIYGRTKDETPRSFDIYVDPGTGRVNGALEPERTVMGWLAHTHFHLVGEEVKLPYPQGTPVWVKTWIGETLSELLMKLTALALMVMVLTGVYIWWPKLSGWKTAFRVRKSPRQYIRDLDWHRLVGIASLPFLFMWALTGLNFYEPFRPAIQKVWYTVTLAGEAPAKSEPPRSVPRPGQAPITAAQARTIAEQRVPEGIFMSYNPPLKADDPVTVWMSVGFDTYREAEWPGNVRLLLDAYSGRVLLDGREEQRSWGARVYDSWFYTTHGATYVPWPIKLLLWGGFGLTPLFLALTGLRIWWHKRRTRLRADSQKRARQAGVDPGTPPRPVLTAVEVSDRR